MIILFSFLWAAVSSAYCDDYAAKHEITCNCNKTIGVLFCPKTYKQPARSKYTQASMKRLRAAYNSAYWIVHYIPRNVSVRSHQVAHCVRTFDALLRNNLYRFFQVWQPASAGKAAEMSELQARHCNDTRTVNLALV